MLLKILSVLFIIGCTTPEKYHKHQLYRQRLVVRLKYPEKLTNQSCKKYKDGECEKWDVSVYDMNDAEFRRKANDFRIVCKIARKRWRICLEQAGYCRRICIKKGWGGKCKKHEEKFIPAANHQYLYDAGTVCKTYLKGD